MLDTYYKNKNVYDKYFMQLNDEKQKEKINYNMSRASVDIPELDKSKMNFDEFETLNMDKDLFYNVVETVWKVIVKNNDEQTKQIITEYAMKKSQEIGERISVVFIDEEIVKEIIDLGIEEYLKRRDKNGKQI